MTSSPLLMKPMIAFRGAQIVGHAGKKRGLLLRLLLNLANVQVPGIAQGDGRGEVLECFDVFLGGIRRRDIGSTRKSIRGRR